MLLTPRMGAVFSLFSGPRVKQLHPVSPGPSESRFLKGSLYIYPLISQRFPLGRWGMSCNRSWVSVWDGSVCARLKLGNAVSAGSG